MTGAISASKAPEVVAALARGQLRYRVPVDDHRAETVADLGGEKADRGSSGQREVAFFHTGRAEVEARRLVDEDPRLEFAVGDGDAHVGSLRARRHVPIDAANVVAGHIGARLARLGSVAGNQTAIVALQQSVELARDRQLEPAQQLTRGVEVVGETGVDYWIRHAPSPLEEGAVA